MKRMTNKEIISNFIKEPIVNKIDWNIIHKAIHKIESIELKINKNTTDYYDVWIMPDCVRIQRQSNEDNPLIIINKSDSVGSINHKLYLFEDKLESVTNAIVEFIKWYSANV